MVMENQISVHFSEFSTIFKKITSHEYSDEQKHEMMEFFKTQTKDRHLSLISKLATSPGTSGGGELDKIGETAIMVLNQDKEAGYACKDLFLSLLDNAISEVVGFGSTPMKYKETSRPVSNNAYLDGEVENYRRKNDKLVMEIHLLRTELEEKMALLDNLEIKNRSLTGLKEQFAIVLEKCNSLELENDSLKNQINLDQNKFKQMLEDAKKSEEKMKNEINSLQDSVSVKRYLIKSYENEKDVMFADFQLLSEEVVERDLIIQSLNDGDERKENLAFLLDSASQSTLSGSMKSSSMSSSSTRLVLPKQTCENCTKQDPGSISVETFGIGKRNNSTATATFDDSTVSLFASAEALNLLPVKPKSIDEELKEIRRSIGEKRKVQLTELIGRMYLLEAELKERREEFEKSSKKLLGARHNANKMLRFRVVQGKLAKMLFTPTTGLRIN